MSRTLSTYLLAGSMTLVGCATPSGTGAAKQTTKQVASNEGQAESVGQPQISPKAKLLFEDAVKANDAQKKAKNVDYSGLEKKFRAAADADPALAEATYNLGVLAERQGKTKDAVALYKAALSRKPSLHQAAENLAVIAQNNGDEKSAMAIFQDILTNYPDDASSRARLAEIYRRRGENEKALELSREALFRDPKTLQAYKTMMAVYYAQKQYSLARLIALRASKLDDNDPEVAYTLGLISLSEKDPAKARVQFKRSVDARPDFLPAHYELVKLAFAQDDFHSAEEHLRRILQANGANPQALIDLGVAYKGMGQLDKAMQLYDDAQKLNGDLPELYLNRGIIIGLKGDPEKAVTMFKTYLARKGGETSVPVEHPVHALIEEQEKAIKTREEEKRLGEEAKKMEDEMKKQEAAAAEEEKKKKDDELKKQQAAAKGGAAKDAVGADKDSKEKKDEKAPPASSEPAPAPKAEEPKPEAKKAAPAPAPPAAAPAPTKKPAADEPTDGL